MMYCYQQLKYVLWCLSTCLDMIDPDVDFDEPVDIFALGFEEIVDLNASNIVSARLVISK